MTPQIAIEILKRYKKHCFGDGRHDGGVVSVEQIIDMLTAQQEITDEQAIDHLQATGWMQEHDRQMYEMGMKEQLKDDSESYDSLIPQDCISRQDAIDAIANIPSVMSVCLSIDECHGMKRMQGMAVRTIKDLPSAQPDLDAIWGKLSKVYNMPDVPDEALSMIGDLMLSPGGRKE